MPASRRLSHTFNRWRTQYSLNGILWTPNSILSLSHHEKEDNPHRSHRTLRQAYLQHKSAEGAICVRHVSVSGALQFAVFHAICRVLHRPASRVIHCPELSRQSVMWLITIITSAFPRTASQFQRPYPGGPGGPASTDHTPPGGLEEHQYSTTRLLFT